MCITTCAYVAMYIWHDRKVIIRICTNQETHAVFADDGPYRQNIIIPFVLHFVCCRVPDLTPYGQKYWQGIKYLHSVLASFCKPFFFHRRAGRHTSGNVYLCRCIPCNGSLFLWHLLDRSCPIRRCGHAVILCWQIVSLVAFVK